MQIIDYIGAVLGVFFAAGYFYQSQFGEKKNAYVEYLWFSCLLLVIAVLSFVAWQYYLQLE